MQTGPAPTSSVAQSPSAHTSSPARAWASPGGARCRLRVNHQQDIQIREDWSAIIGMILHQTSVGETSGWSVWIKTGKSQKDRMFFLARLAAGKAASGCLKSTAETHF